MPRPSRSRRFLPARGTAAIAVVVSVLLWTAGLALPAAPASAYQGTDVQIIIDSPAENATVSGTVDVTYTVTALVGTPIGRADATFAGSAQETDLTDQDCSAGCSRTASFDTTSSPLPWNGDTARWTDDGPQWFTVAVEVNGTWASEEVGVIVNNHRPTVTVQGMDADGLYPLTAHDSITISAYPAAHQGGRITGMYYILGNTETPMKPPATPGDPWTYTVDTSAQTNTYVASAVRARDERGIENIGTRVAYVIDHGPTLTAPTIADPIKDDDLNAVQLAYRYSWFATSLPETRPQTVVTLLDGQEVHRDDAGLWEYQHPGKVLGYSGIRVPGGDHTLTYVLTDNRGGTGSLEVPIHVTPTLFGQFDSGAEAVALPGVDLPVTASAKTTNSTIWFWQILVDGLGVNSGGPQNTCTSDCPTTLNPEATLRNYPPGKHKLELTLIPKSGHPLTVESSFTVLPYAVAKLKPATATYDKPLTLRGTATSTGDAPAANATAVLQRRTYGTTSWQDISTAAADSQGNVSFTVQAGRSESYRLRTTTKPASWAGSIGATITVPSRASITMRKTPTSVRRRQLLTVSATVLPKPSKNTVMRLQRYTDGHWVTVSREWFANTTGSINWKYRPRSTGWQKLRLVRPAANGLIGTYEPAWLLRVHR